jgi:hypothetical protein
MSAFLVEKKTIDRILSLVASECRRSKWFTKELTEKLNADVSEAHWRDRLGQKMWDLNQLSLGYRYGDKKEDLRYFFDDVSGYTNQFQMFKSLKCWLYQCAEGESPEKSVLYRVFSHEISLYLAMRIVQSTPEYEQAEWG